MPGAMSNLSKQSKNLEITPDPAADRQPEDEKKVIPVQKEVKPRE